MCENINVIGAPLTKKKKRLVRNLRDFSFVGHHTVVTAFALAAFATTVTGSAVEYASHDAGCCCSSEEKRKSSCDEFHGGKLII